MVTTTEQSAEQPTSTQPGRARWLPAVWSTDVGKKYAMAVSGIVGLLFVFFHMVGNLHTFEGAAPLNEYGEALRDIGHPIIPRTFLLWGLRFVLAAALAVHVWAAWSLVTKNREARGTAYKERNYYAVNYASRTMGWAGIIILLFLAWHLADLTIGVEAVNPEFRRGEVYDNLLASLERWPVTLLYIIAMGALALHLWHGAWSMFQSLGVNNPHFNRFRRTFASVFTIIVVAGFLTIPIGVQLGIIS